TLPSGASRSTKMAGTSTVPRLSGKNARVNVTSSALMFSAVLNTTFGSEAGPGTGASPALQLPRVWVRNPTLVTGTGRGGRGRAQGRRRGLAPEVEPALEVARLGAVTAGELQVHTRRGAVELHAGSRERLAVEMDHGAAGRLPDRRIGAGRPHPSPDPVPLQR